MYIDTMSMSGHTYGRPDLCLLGVSLTETHKQYNTAAEVYIKSSMDQYLGQIKNEQIVKSHTMGHYL